MSLRVLETQRTWSKKGTGDNSKRLYIYTLQSLYFLDVSNTPDSSQTRPVGVFVLLYIVLYGGFGSSRPFARRCSLNILFTHAERFPRGRCGSPFSQKYIPHKSRLEPRTFPVVITIQKDERREPTGKPETTIQKDERRGAYWRRGGYTKRKW